MKEEIDIKDMISLVDPYTAITEQLDDNLSSFAGGMEQVQFRGALKSFVVVEDFFSM